MSSNNTTDTASHSTVPNNRSSDGAPWRSRPAGQALLGRSAEAALSRSEGQSVVIDAFEVGTLRTPNRGWKILALVLLSPIWIFVFLFACAVMVLPSWIYLPYRTYREWDEAKRLGVSPGMMIFGIVLVFGFGIIGGMVMTAILLGKAIPLGNVVVVARTGDRVVLLYQRMPMFNFPEFRKAEYFPSDSLSQDSVSTRKKIVLSLRTTDGDKKIVVRRLATWATGSPEINEENLAILLHR